MKLFKQDGLAPAIIHSSTIHYSLFSFSITIFYIIITITTSSSSSPLSLLRLVTSLLVFTLIHPSLTFFIFYHH